MLDLILKDIDDQYVRENFYRLRKFLSNQVLFDGNFTLYDITVPGADDNFKIPHGLTFIPQDIIPLAAEGNYNYFFKYSDFDKENIYVNANGPVRLRFLAGKLSDKTNNNSQKLATTFPFVVPGDTASPGFVYGAVNSKTAGFWLTSEGIPTNVVGIPVLFVGAHVIQVAVGTEVESDYTLGVYQHEGAGVNLQLLGSIPIASGGTKRIVVDFPITYSSPNIQLACRLLSGTTLNLKVSLVIKGSST